MPIMTTTASEIATLLSSLYYCPLCHQEIGCGGNFFIAGQQRIKQRLAGGRPHALARLIISTSYSTDPFLMRTAVPSKRWRAKPSNFSL